MSEREQVEQCVSKALAKNPDVCQQDIMEVGQSYTDLLTSVDEFVFNNGDRKELLNIGGTIPMAYKETHPFNPPMVFVCPTSYMRISEGKYVDGNGRVSLPYLHEWKHPTSNLTALVGALSAAFGVCPPLYSISPSRHSSTHGSGLSHTLVGSPQTLCGVCLEKEKVIAFIPCGHLTCADCSGLVNKCPECRGVIRDRLKIYL